MLTGGALTLDISPALYKGRSARTDDAVRASVSVPPQLIKNNYLHLRSSQSLTTKGRPALRLPIPLSFLRDVGIRLLAGYELGFAGYEYPYRQFLINQLRQGDVLLDIGAHWGLYSLTATGLGAPGVKAVAVEAFHGNLPYLQGWLNANRAKSNTALVSAAIGDRAEIVLFAESHSMGGRLADAAGDSKTPGLNVPVVTLDWLVEQMPAPSGRYVLKIDVEGSEAAVLRGARELLNSGRVAAVIWEYHHPRDHQTTTVDGLALLSDAGFRHYMFAHPHMGGLLLPFTAWPGVRNVISLPGPPEAPEYTGGQAGPFAPLPPPYHNEMSEGERIAITRALVADETSDAIRWADPLSRSEGAAARLAVAAEHIGGAGSVLDIGCGGNGLRGVLPGGVRYLGIDLAAPGLGGLLADLNRQDLSQILGAQSAFDFGTALGVLEYIHDIARLLAALSKVCRRLAITYDHSWPDTPDRRLALGYVNNLPSGALVAMLDETGWTGVVRRDGDVFSTYLADRKSS